jgi:hypothetical protein
LEGCLHLQGVFFGLDCARVGLVPHLRHRLRVQIHLVQQAGKLSFIFFLQMKIK